MHHYFDFNHSFNEALSATKTKEQIKDTEYDHIQAWNKQVSVNRDLGLSSQDYKQLDNISSLMTEYKSALQQKWGAKEGAEKYNEMILENGSLTEQDAAKKLYNGLNYAVSFGATGKDMSFSDSFLDNNKQEVSNQVLQSLQTVLPNIPHDFMNELVDEYKHTHSHQVTINRKSHEIGHNVSREAQIKFVRENVDNMYTNTQRFKETWSEVKQFYVKDINLITAIITAPVALPALAAASMVKVFGGEAGQMKMHDIIDSVGKNLEMMKDNVKSFFKAGVTNKIQAIRQTRLDNGNENRFKM